MVQVADLSQEMRWRLSRHLCKVK